jgi:hypothetical protein
MNSQIKINSFIAYIFSFLLISCLNTSKSFLELESCVNEKLVDKINSYNNFDNANGIIDNKLSLFNSIANFENQLIQQKLLLGKTQEDYLKLIIKLEELKELKSYFKNIIDDNLFLDHLSNDFATMSFLYDVCPREVGLSNDIRNVYFEIFKEGYPTTDILNKLIRRKDFNNEVFRKSICYLIFVHCKYENKSNEQ